MVMLDTVMMLLMFDRELPMGRRVITGKESHLEGWGGGRQLRLRLRPGVELS
jgi:hypothetical protein